MAPRDSLTILHLSDPQFGRNHRFGRLGLPTPDDTFDSLLKRLQIDLERMREDEGLKPDLLIVTGDLAEEGKRSEFDDALELIHGLHEVLEIGPERTVVVPGNHDINWPACKAYFFECESDEDEPAPPFWPKWRHYERFFKKLYQDQPQFEFSEGQPWTLFELPELKTVVAGLNSTMVESHRDDDHYGHVGETQLHWFREKLKSFVEEGWLRIGTVHHNVRRGPFRDDENLRDVDDLARILGESLHVLLHGHTHFAEMSRLGERLPVFSTGSAALSEDVRPGETPNEYQFLKVRGDRIERWARQFDPSRKEWIGDTRATKKGRAWHSSHDVQLAYAQTAFSPLWKGRGSHDKGFHEEGSGPGHPKNRVGGRHYDFLDRVAAVCRLKHAEAEVRRMDHPMPRISYLRVTQSKGRVVQQHPVGAHQQGVSMEVVEPFLPVHRRYRETDYASPSEFVYGGDRAPKELVERMRAQGLVLQSFVEYQGLIDFRDYVKRQTRRLNQDENYPASLYVPQRMKFELGDEEQYAEDALAQLMAWLTERRDSSRFVLVLGSFGTGKTFLLRELARRMGKELAEESGHGLIPLLVELRSLEKAQNLTPLLANQLAKRGMDIFDTKALDYMIRAGRIVLFFDGFDELAVRVTYPRAAEHLASILEAVQGSAKVVLSSRTQHFESDRQVRTALGKKINLVEGHRIVHLQPFEPEQVHEFFVNLLRDEEAAQERLRILDDVNDLLGLSKNPRMLSFIAQLDEEALRRAREKHGVISAADLYQVILNKWLGGEVERAQPRGAAPPLSEQQRLEAVIALARKLWTRTDKTVSVEELARETAQALEALEDVRLNPDSAAHQVGSGTLLVRDSEGAFSFAHQSILEWLVAKDAAGKVRAGKTPEILAHSGMSDLMADFFSDLAGPEEAIAWAHNVLGDESAETLLQDNAFMVLDRLGQEAREPLRRVGEDLRGGDFSGRDLRGADFSMADLREASFRGSNLQKADFSEALLQGADLSEADLTGAELSGAGLQRVRLLGAILRGADLAGADLYRAALVGVKTSGLPTEHALGAALPNSPDPLPWVTSPRAKVHVLAWSPRGDLVAAGYDDGLICIWDVTLGVELHRLRGHRDVVVSLGWARSGILASGGQEGAIHLWTPEGEELKSWIGHNGRVWSLDWNRAGDVLVSGGTDGLVRWWSATGEELHQVLSHGGSVWSVKWSPTDEFVASSGSGGVVQLWSPYGDKVQRLEGFDQGVPSLSWRKSGELLAGGGHDGVIRMWRSSGEVLHVLESHENRITGLSWSKSEDMLASCDEDGIVQIWSAPGEVAHRLEAHEGAVLGLSWAQLGDLLATGGRDGVVRVWSFTGEELQRFERYKGGILSLSWSGLEDLLATGGDDGMVRFWTSTGEELHSLEGHRGSVLSLNWSDSLQLLASGGSDGTVRVCSSSGEVVSLIDGHSFPITKVCWSQSGELATGDSAGMIHVWSASGEKRKSLKGHRDRILGLSWSSSGNLLASGGADGLVRIWRLSTGEELHRLEGYNGLAWSVSWSTSEDVLASSGADGIVRLWSLSKGSLDLLEGHSEDVVCLGWSKEGDLLASGGFDEVVRVWSSSGEEVQQLKGSGGWIGDLTFFRDDDFLAAACRDGTITIWEVETGRHVASLAGLPEGWVAFAPDGRYKLGGDPGNHFWHTIGLVRFAPGELDPYLPGGKKLRVPDGEALF